MGKPWWKLSKESKDILDAEAKKLTYYAKETNCIWKENWKYFIEREFPDAGLFELVQFKLVEMRESIRSRQLGNADFLIKKLDEIISLGDKIFEDNYLDEWYDWYKENTTSVTSIYLKNNKSTDAHSEEPIVNLYGLTFMDDMKSKLAGDTGAVEQWLKDHDLKAKDVCCSYGSEWNDKKLEQENENYSKKLYKKCVKQKQQDTTKYFKLVAKYIMNSR